MLKAILLVGIGGGTGSILRFLISYFMNKFSNSLFPWPTFLANILGSFIIGLLLAYLGKSLFDNDDMRFLMVVGFCGGFTTFSTFSAESLNLLNSGYTTLALIYILLSVCLGVIAAWLGLTLGK